MDKIYVDAIGLNIRVDAGKDINAATNTTVEVKKPDGTTASWTATVVDDNYLSYNTIAGDIDQAGVYRIQASMELGGWVGRGETAELMVYGIYS